jgi:hypothetical protein
MLSSNTGARLYDGESQIHDTQNCGDLSSDSDTVRLVEIDLLGADQSEFKYWIVIWSENGVEKPPRRFWDHRDALIFSRRLKCRLDIDAYARECAALTAKKENIS